MIHVGTSGYSYDDWHGPFYPERLAPAERLAWYARFFDCTEINTTYYRQPTERLCAGLAAKVPAAFRFAVKAWGGLTHDHEAATRADFVRFERALAPLAEQGQLACVLAQFPHGFAPTRATVAYVRRLRDEWPALPLVVEFRHVGWHDERAAQLAVDLGLGWCNVDEPALPGLLPATERCTADPAYVRFHGRNAARWYNHSEAWERYDYLYDTQTLHEWVPRIKRLADAADSIYVFFNNHYVAQAVVNARDLLDELGLNPGESDAAEAVDVNG
ncbi:MAG: DUF72 domain-containing protein [Armatimonadetes bacterium]|nr:DUF72 domain-containing protein [Armatimonadota bacterium]